MSTGAEGGVWYLDASAIVKTVIAEPESPPLMRWLADRDELVTSDLSRVEVIRAVRRADPEAVPRAREVLATLTLIRLDETLLDAAAALEPAPLRSLDAIHLAAVLAIGDALAGVVTFDARMAEAARALGVRVEAPGAP